ncbi:MAG: hypothetical protein WC319_09235 [Candidatus Paceibacterota bacterium]|jgi:hypothetical protein
MTNNAIRAILRRFDDVQFKCGGDMLKEEKVQQRAEKGAIKAKLQLSGKTD